MNAGVDFVLSITRYQITVSAVLDDPVFCVLLRIIVYFPVFAVHTVVYVPSMLNVVLLLDGRLPADLVERCRA